MNQILVELAAEILRELGYDAWADSHGYVRIRLHSYQTPEQAREDYKMALADAESEL